VEGADASHAISSIHSKISRGVRGESLGKRNRLADREAPVILCGPASIRAGGIRRSLELSGQRSQTSKFYAAFAFTSIAQCHASSSEFCRGDRTLQRVNLISQVSFRHRGIAIAEERQQRVACAIVYRVSSGRACIVFEASYGAGDQGMIVTHSTPPRLGLSSLGTLLTLLMPRCQWT